MDNLSVECKHMPVAYLFGLVCTYLLVRSRWCLRELEHVSLAECLDPTA